MNKRKDDKNKMIDAKQARKKAKTYRLINIENEIINKYRKGKTYADIPLTEAEIELLESKGFFIERYYNTLSM